MKFHLPPIRDSPLKSPYPHGIVCVCVRVCPLSTAPTWHGRMDGWYVFKFQNIALTIDNSEAKFVSITPALCKSKSISLNRRTDIQACLPLFPEDESKQFGFLRGGLQYTFSQQKLRSQNGFHATLLSKSYDLQCWTNLLASNLNLMLEPLSLKT